MLDAMRQLALSRLWLDLDGGKSPDPEKWYRHLRERELGKLFPYLVEDQDDEGRGGEKPRYYTLTPDPKNPSVAVLEAHEFRAGDGEKLPFNQPSGSQSAALGPLIKRTAPSKSKPAGPSLKIQQTTLNAFRDIAAEGEPWSDYFRSAHECWTRGTLRYNGQQLNAAGGALSAAVEKIEEKRTVLLAFRTSDDVLPGAVPEYANYLQRVLADTKYATGAVPAVAEKTCALCGQERVTVYANALRGAGINLGNLDRDGAFPGMEVQSAWRYFALCVGCADLLYVYWHHVAKKDFRTRVAGEEALVIPTLNLDPVNHKKLLERVKTWGPGVDAGSPGRESVMVSESRLLHVLSDDRAVNTLTILWAEFGQRIDEVRGIVADVLPSRLHALAEINKTFESTASPVFPEIKLDDFRPDVSFTLLRPLLQRPGGKKAQRRNESRRLFGLRRDIADAVYHAERIPAGRLWDEIAETARWHWDAACATDKAVYQLLYEGWSAKRKEPFLTVAGWVRQLARFLHYCRVIGVMPMPDPDRLYQPGAEGLKPYFGPESAIDSRAKAFAFILGALYGKLLQVQAARHVNVGANALTWLKRLTLAGSDLPALYVKVREKLMVYGTEGNASVREVVAELSELGTRLGTNIELDETQTCYFLLLGQSLAVKILPSKDATGGDRHD